MESFYKSYKKSQYLRIPVGVGLLGLYGVFVCPLIDSLPWYTLAATFSSGFAVAIIPYFLILSIAFRNLENPKVFFHNHIGFILVFAEILYWLAGAWAVASIHEEIFGFPFGLSGAKLGFSSLLIGVLSSTLNILAFEGILLKNMTLEKNQPQLPAPSFSTMSQKIILALVAIAITSTLAISLLIFKDLNLIHYSHRKEIKKTVANLTMKKPVRSVASSGNAGFSPGAMMTRQMGFLGQSKIYDAILLEVGFCLLIIFGFLFFITRQFIENIKTLLRLKARLFEDFRKDNFDKFLPVLRHDEFGIISNEVNDIVLQLAEKNRIRSIFGKYISPKVAQRILSSHDEPQLGGENKEVAILFSDIRNYTELSESIPPDQLVPLLNSFFTEMVEVISRHNSVLDKFLGDGLMAFFDLGPKENERSATLAAMEMVERAQALADNWVQAGGKSFKIGVGVHSGEVLIGNIGSEQRLEFTIIGSSVNTAARLESLSKEMAGPIAISSTVFEKLPQELRSQFKNSGEHHLRGQKQSQVVYNNNKTMSRFREVS